MTVLHNEDVKIDGGADAKQLVIEGHSIQTQPLQVWQNNTSTILAQMTGDGRLQIGDDLGLATPDALVEVHRDSTSTAKPKRGIHSLGRIASALTEAVAWLVGELEIVGTAGVQNTHTALRGRITHFSTGDSSSAELRAGDLEAINESGAAGTKVGEVVGLHTAVSNKTSGFTNQAKGLEVVVKNENAASGAVTSGIGIDITVGDASTSSNSLTEGYGIRIQDVSKAQTNYALHTGKGLVRLGDALDLAAPNPVPGNPPTNTMRLYSKTDGKVYAKNSSGTEFDLTPPVVKENGTQIVTNADTLDFKDFDVIDLTNGDAAIYHNLPGICEGRLTLDSTNPVPTSDVTAATTVHFARFRGSRISLYDPSASPTRWQVHAIPLTPPSLAIPATRNTNYDIFVYWTGSTLALEATAWNAPASGSITGATNAFPIVVTSNNHGLSNDQLVTITGVGGNTAANGLWRVNILTANTFELLTLAKANSTGNGTYTSGGTWQRADQNTTRATQLALQDGVYVRSGAASRRYLGTIRTLSDQTAGRCEDSKVRRFVWNYYHRLERRFEIKDANSSWNYLNATTWRPWRQQATSRVEFVQGLAEDPIYLNFIGAAQPEASAYAMTGIGLDVSNATSTTLNMSTPQGITAMTQSTFNEQVTSGYHFLQLVEWFSAFSTVGTTFFGSVTTGYQAGATGHIKG
jgi:hypothetical protein